jgi:hypothetical protein
MKSSYGLGRLPGNDSTPRTLAAGPDQATDRRENHA